MRLVAFDLETTGTNPQTDQILEIGAVCFDADTGETIGEFETLVKHDRYEGDPFALQMNHKLLKRLADGEGMNEYRACNALRARLSSWGFSSDWKGRAQVVGFNVGAFDLQFINRVDGRQYIPGKIFSHRAIELGTLLMHHCRSLAPVPSSQAVKLLDKDREVAHTALQDARDARDLYLLATQGIMD